MPKSKYPSQLDTSTELPPVRDNIVEAGSDIINSLRSAIINIEKTLGINPQGSVGNTLAERLNRSLDSSGNIKSDALNSVSNPLILDSNVSSVAAIQESKIKLNYPTSLLQDEISILNATYESLVAQLEELNTLLSIHLNENAINRHPATAISLETSESEPSDIALINLDDDDVQSFASNVISKHINYSGADITEFNNSHESAQIYFDNINVEDLINGSDLQTVIEEVAELSQNSQTLHQDLFHSNGILKAGKITTALTEYGSVLVADAEVSFSVGNNIIAFNPTIAIEDNLILKSDILTITDESDTESVFAKSYEIDYTIITSGFLTHIVLFENLLSDSTSISTATITKNIKKLSSNAGLLFSIREDAASTSAKHIQISNPNAVAVTSKNIRPYEINVTNRYMNISINGGTNIILDMYNGAVTTQTLDGIILKINEQVAEANLNFLAYRLDKAGQQSELVISYNAPDDGDDQFTITISRGSDDVIDAAGFAYIEDQVINSEYGLNYFINGQSYTGLKNKINIDGLNFLATNDTITSSSSLYNFTTLGVKPGDMIIISDAVSSSDNGSYLISSVSDEQIMISSDQLPSGFVGDSQSTTNFKVYENVISVDDITFEEVNSGFGATLLEVFLNENRNISYSKLIEYESPLYGTIPLISLVDVDGNFYNQQFSLSIEDKTSYIRVSLDDGETVDINSNYSSSWILSGNSNVKLKIFFHSISNILGKLGSLGTDLVITFYSLNKVNNDSNLIIGKIHYNNYSGRLGVTDNYNGLNHSLNYGTISPLDISTSTLNILTEQPIFDLRSNGVISGLKIVQPLTTGDIYSFDVSGGICYVAGKRITITEQTLFQTTLVPSVTDKIFIAVDEFGTIHAAASLADCKCPFNPHTHCILATLEYNGTEIFNIDLRLFINDIDFKILNSITVSPEKGLGHFDTFRNAIRYSKRFSELFPNAGYPTVHLKSGIHEVIVRLDNSDITYSTWNGKTDDQKNEELYDELIDSGLVLDFPVNITGEGHTSVLKISSRYIFSDQTYNLRGRLAVIGNGYSNFNNPAVKFTSGFSLYQNFTMDNCGFEFADLNIEDGYGQFNFGQSIDNVIFDCLDHASNPQDNSKGPIVINIAELDDEITSKGNINISNCQFYTENVAGNTAVVNLPDPTRIKNFSCINNKLYCEDDTSKIRLLSEDIWSFDYADSGANITISGNLSASNFNVENDADAPKMILGRSGWGDRISRSLNVGGDINSVGNIDSGGTGNFSSTVTGSAFNYGTVQNRYKTIFFDQISHTAFGNISSGTDFGQDTIDGQYFRTIEFDDGSSDFCILRLEILPGEILDDITAVFSTEDPASSVFAGFYITITSRNEYGNSTVRLTETSLGSVTGGLGSLNEVAVQGISNLNLAGANNKYYFIKLRRAAATGYTQHLLYVQYKTNVSTVQGIGGLS